MSSKTSYLKIVNESMEGLTVFISQVDSYDWEGQNRPDKNFENVWIGIDQSVEKKEEMNSHANSAWLRITLRFVSGQMITFRIDQRKAISDSSTSVKEIQTESVGEHTNSNTKYVVTQKIDKSHVTNTITVKSAKFKENYNEWMASVSGNKLISHFSIPGTYSSLSYGQNAVMYRYQSLSISQQLDAGVRYLDFNAIARKQGIYVAFGPKGEIVGKRDEFRNTIEIIQKFLKKNCTETVIVSVHEVDQDIEFFRKRVSSFIEEYHNLIYTKDSVPYLDDVRGKIVLVRRFDTSGIQLGINMYNGWPVDGTGYFKYKALNGVEYKFSVQNNYYPVSYEEKYVSIYKEMCLAKDNDAFFVNLSGITPQAIINSMEQYAIYVNERMARDISNLGATRNYGSLLLVYPTITLVHQVALTAIERTLR